MYKICRTKEKHKSQFFATLAMKNRLYVPKWSLYSLLRNIERRGGKIALCFDGDKPIGVAALEEDEDFDTNVLVFVRKPYRGQGIGSKLIKQLKTYEKNLYHYCGVEGSEIFFAKNGVKP